MAESHGWWKLTFLRKRQSAPTVLYESPDSLGAGAGAGASQEGPGPEGPPGFAARLEKLVDKSSKGKHVKVSNSGRFKEKKKVRATLAENPNLCPGSEQEEKGPSPSSAPGNAGPWGFGRGNDRC
ncbi:proline-rich protein 15-like protein isoform 2-T2 [Ara ararauna]